MCEFESCINDKFFEFFGTAHASLEGTSSTPKKQHINYFWDHACLFWNFKVCFTCVQPSSPGSILALEARSSSRCGMPLYTNLCRREPQDKRTGEPGRFSSSWHLMGSVETLWVWDQSLTPCLRTWPSTQAQQHRFACQTSILAVHGARGGKGVECVTSCQQSLHTWRSYFLVAMLQTRGIARASYMQDFVAWEPSKHNSLQSSSDATACLDRDCSGKLVSCQRSWQRWYRGKWGGAELELMSTRSLLADVADTRHSSSDIALHSPLWKYLGSLWVHFCRVMVWSTERPRMNLCECS